MRTIADLFSQSPIAPLATHMDSVSSCVHKMMEMWALLKSGGSYAQLEALCVEVSQLEHDADQIKNEIRRNVPTRLFMAVDRQQILKILSRQDDVADIAEDVAVIMSLHPISIPAFLRDELNDFLSKNIRSFELASLVSHELHQLSASSFGGAEAEKVRDLSEQCAFAEHEVDLIQRRMIKLLLAHADELSKADFFVWQQLLAKVSQISDASESLAKNIHLTIDA